ncbi:MAG: tyrosine-type recombinase/integrase, partial [Candidatus Eremiobacteraeota bacterium]|nr:tyrosine-type recombinase/integrase [Candidatus Eremiobacteraeota bacterium]
FHQRLLWKPGMRGRMLSRPSVYGALKTLSLFLRWAFSQEYLLFDPMAGLKLGKPQHPFPRVPTVAEMKELLEVPDLSTPQGLRDRAILEVLYVLGLRRRECYNLDLTDVNLNRRQLAVRSGKLKKDRLLPMSEGLTRTLNRYLGKGRPGLRPMRSEPALFVSPASGRRLHYESLRARVQRLGQKIGLALYPHALRHACATHLLEGGADLRYVQEILGHATVTSTQIYTKISPMELHEVFRRTHPRAHTEQDD